VILLEHRDVYWKDALWFFCAGYLFAQALDWLDKKWEQRKRRRKYA
jgi:hypothetical protein